MLKHNSLPALRWMVIASLTALLPAIFGQEILRGCLVDTDCSEDGVARCCLDTLFCSVFESSSLPIGSTCSSDCECITRSCVNWTCVCSFNFHCIDDTTLDLGLDQCCREDGTCSYPSMYLPGQPCEDGCDCKSGLCPNGICECFGDSDCSDVGGCCKMDKTCSFFVDRSVKIGESCADRCECKSYACTDEVCVCAFHADCTDEGLGCCKRDGTCSSITYGSLPGGSRCSDDCECRSGSCYLGKCAGLLITRAPSPAPYCPPGSDICNDPHLKGLRGQRIDVVGIDGGWYCLVKDPDIDIQVNVRFTAPLPVEFPHRQLITGIALLSNGHSLVMEAKNPYDTSTNGCPDNISPCLVDGGLRITVDEEEMDQFLHPNRDATVFDDITISASNLPVECRQFGGEKIWARMYEEMLQGQRRLQAESFEDWVLRFDTMAAHDWCTKYIAERGLGHVQSKHGVFKITTPTVVIRLNAGINHQGEGELDWDGRALPKLDFWQMDVGFEGLAVNHVGITGILGETAHPVLDDQGHEVMSGDNALRGTVEDFRVSGPLETNFPLLHQN